MIFSIGDGYQLECSDTKSNEICSRYQVKIANCTNLNYRKSHEPDWECDYLDLNSKVVAIGQIRCDYPLGTLPEDIPYIYKKDTCILTYSLKLIADQDLHPIKAFKDTKKIGFVPDTKVGMFRYTEISVYRTEKF